MNTFDPVKQIYPVFVQPKLNGVYAEWWTDGYLRSKTGKYFPAVQQFFTSVNRPLHRLKGELYVHGWPLQDILSAVSPDEPKEKSELIQFHCYDVDYPTIQLQRRCVLGDKLFIDDYNPSRFRLVSTFRADNFAELESIHRDFLSRGYEGSIVREMYGYDTVKYKPTFDEEFLCVGVTEGEGKRAGHVGYFILRMPDGRTFNCGGGKITYNELAHYLQHPPTNKLLTVQYSYKSKNGIPQSAQFIRVRDNQDL